MQLFYSVCQAWRKVPAHHLIQHHLQPAPAHHLVQFLKPALVLALVQKHLPQLHLAPAQAVAHRLGAALLQLQPLQPLQRQDIRRVADIQVREWEGASELFGNFLRNSILPKPTASNLPC